jgi:L-ascorbate metabolism protein UlaG (beta-lactamase superfamily)
MTIQWYGQAFFRIESKDVVLAIDPFSKKPEWGFNKVPRFRADIVLISHDHPDHNNVSGIDGSPFVINSPGEYEVKGIFIQGIQTFHDDVEGKERGTNTVFLIEIENMRICHMGDIGMKKLPEEVLEKLSNIDFLLVPVGGTYTIDGKVAWDFVKEIEPKIVVPMHYKIEGLKLPISGVENFLKIAGKKPEIVEKISLRKKDLPQDGPKIYLMKPHIDFSAS